MSGWSIDERLDTAANADVLRYLRRESPSAHSDVAEALGRAAAGLSGVRSYCPDPERYAFVALHLDDGTIVGLAYGMSGLALRIPAERRGHALSDGGASAPELGADWIRFEPWTDGETLDESRARIARWCAAAAGGQHEPT